MQSLQKACRHGFVVFLRVAEVGEYLSESLLVVDVTEVAVLREILLIGIIGVDVGGSVVAVGLAVDKALQGQAVAERTLFGRPANGQRGNGHDETWQLEDVLMICWG